MIECPICGSYVRHEHAAHECDVLNDKYEGIQPWYGMAELPEDTPDRLPDGTHASKDANPKEESK